MNVWINKCVEDAKTTLFDNSVTFNISIPGKDGRISSNIRDGWYRILGIKEVTPICEDLYIIALSVFATDKRIVRSDFSDGWTRILHLNIPVIEIEKWISVKEHLEKILSYLSGDIWKINFRRSNERYKDPHKKEPKNRIDLGKYNCVSLFSGGLDSFCGAYDLLSNNKKPMFVGYKEYGKLKYIQNDLLNQLDKSFPSVNKHLFLFTAKANKPIGYEGKSAENTSRSRSFLFLCAAICIAEIIGDATPVFIPENGFVGLNLPLTPSRKGSCSTRTTHPYFIRIFNEMLSKLGVNHTINNPYAYMTKREMVSKIKDHKTFVDCIHKTISCSHPCNGRWEGFSDPANCGYCYPCLIRQSSLLDLQLPLETYRRNDAVSYNFINSESYSKKSDLVDLISSVYRAKNTSDVDLLKLIRQTGRLSNDECQKFLRLYRQTLNDLIQLFSKDPELIRIMGLNYATN